jgi:hypothetical protein
MTNQPDTGEIVEHGSQCEFSSRQADWCAKCQHDWQAGAFLRFSRGITIVAGTAQSGRPSDG